jgi:hypothetical protein
MHLCTPALKRRVIHFHSGTSKEDLAFFITSSLKDEELFKSLTEKYERLGKMLHNYIESVRNDYKKKS